jgi:Tat protein secretion system quality control protein TatD with DNase activity
MEHRKLSSCPCCAFISNDWFLPESERFDNPTISAPGRNRNEVSRAPFVEESLQQPTNDDDDGGHYGDTIMSTAQAWQLLLQATKSIANDDDGDGDHRLRRLPIVVDTHGHAHLERGDELADSAQAALYRVDHDGVFDTSSSISSSAIFLETNEEQIQDATTTTTTTKRQHQPLLPPCYLSLTCAVQQADWADCLAYAAANPYRMAAIGIHPWYLADLSDDWLEQLERILQQHAGVMVGEIGLCKMARFLRTYEPGKQAAFALQRKVFVQQLQLAARYQRPVSIHCVNQQGVLLDIFKEQYNQHVHHQLLIPPAMALHSFTGTAHQVKMLLAWEATLILSKEETATPLLYFGFSHVVNHAMCTSEKSRRQGREAIRMVPADRLLAESDLHVKSHILGGTVAAIAYLAWALDKDVVSVAQQTRDNALRFFQRLQQGATAVVAP